MTRPEAIAAGAKRYFTGKPCPHGHVSERYVSTMQCAECVRARDASRDEAEARATRRAYRQRNPDKVRALKAADQRRNSEKANARKKRWVEANREQVRATNAAWQKANPGMNCAKTMRRKADQLQRMPSWADQKAIQAIYERAAAMRADGLDVQVDHEIPLRGRLVSGLHVHDNLQIIPAIVNKSKSNAFRL